MGLIAKREIIIHLGIVSVHNRKADKIIEDGVPAENPPVNPHGMYRIAGMFYGVINYRSVMAKLHIYAVTAVAERIVADINPLRTGQINPIAPGVSGKTF